MIIKLIIVLLVLYIIWLSVNPWKNNFDKYELYDHIDNNYKLKSYKVDNITIYEKIINRQINYPFIIKPIICNGSGNGVRKINNLNEIEDYMITNREKEYIIQEFFNPKYEVGVLYEKYPINRDGKIISITMKHKNGNKNLNNWKPLSCGTIINNQPTICSNITGNYSKIEKTINEISNKIPNFYAGRYDIGFDNLEDFMNGKNFKIYEINGVMGFDLSFLFSNNDTICNRITKIGKILRWIIVRFIIGTINVIKLNVQLDSIFNIGTRIHRTFHCNNWEQLFSPSSA